MKKVTSIILMVVSIVFAMLFTGCGAVEELSDNINNVGEILTSTAEGSEAINDVKASFETENANPGLPENQLPEEEEEINWITTTEDVLRIFRVEDYFVVVLRGASFDILYDDMYELVVLLEEESEEESNSITFSIPGVNPDERTFPGAHASCFSEYLKSGNPYKMYYGGSLQAEIRNFKNTHVYACEIRNTVDPDFGVVIPDNYCVYSRKIGDETSEGDVIMSGQTADICETLTADEFLKTYNSMLKESELLDEYRPQLDWSGEKYVDRLGHVCNVDITPGGLVHIEFFDHNVKNEYYLYDRINSSEIGENFDTYSSIIMQEIDGRSKDFSLYLGDNGRKKLSYLWFNDSSELESWNMSLWEEKTDYEKSIEGYVADYDTYMTWSLLNGNTYSEINDSNIKLKLYSNGECVIPIIINGEMYCRYDDSLYFLSDGSISGLDEYGNTKLIGADSICTGLTAVSRDTGFVGDPGTPSEVYYKEITIDGNLCTVTEYKFDHMYTPITFENFKTVELDEGWGEKRYDPFSYTFDLSKVVE